MRRSPDIRGRKLCCRSVIMHEMSLAISIVELICEKALETGAERITAIELEVGRLSGFMPEALVFCFAAAAQGTPAAGASLEIREVEGLGRCLDCGREFAVSVLPAQCQGCAGYAVEVARGRELKVVSLTVDE